jgi:hypothetical protein
MLRSAERSLLVLTPFAAIAAVMAGLLAGARIRVRAAVVFGAPLSEAGVGLSWQIRAFEEVRGARSSLNGAALEVTLQSGAQVSRWLGQTNDEGVAEARLDPPPGLNPRLEVRSNGALLAAGQPIVPARSERSPPLPVWMPYARRQGPLVIDVAVLGQRVAPEFPATIWVRVTEARTGLRLGGVTIHADSDSSLSFQNPTAMTDSAGWGEISATPVGLATMLTLRATARDGRWGDWEGGLFALPGGLELETRARWPPDQSPTFRIEAPTKRKTGYLEVDDAMGRAWATAVVFPSEPGASPVAEAQAPRLAPGLYWAVAASDPSAAATLGPAAVRPFFVSASDEAALRLGFENAQCAVPADIRLAARALGPCLATTGARAVHRWVALDGFALQRAEVSRRREHGVAVSAGAVLVAMILETMLVLRAWASAQTQLRGLDARPPPALTRISGVVVAVLVSVLGLALLAVFLVTASE